MKFRELNDSEKIKAGDTYRIPHVDMVMPCGEEMFGKTRPEVNAETPLIPTRILYVFRACISKLIYVAGPFRGPDAWSIEQNIRRAEELSLEVWRNQMAALCPHTNTRFFQGAAPDEVWLQGTLEMLRRCDAVLLVQGWWKSSGSRAEVKEAIQREIPVFESLADLVNWSKQPDHFRFSYTDQQIQRITALTEG